MRYILVLLVVFSFSCNQKKEAIPETIQPFSKVNIEFLHTDSTSIRAIALGNQEVMYAGSNGRYGFLNTNANSNEITKGTIDFLGEKPVFRSIASTKEAFYMLSIESPALLYRYDKKSNDLKLVFTNENEKAFYDSMTFWNDQEGIAMGDPIDNCLSILITRDGGFSWNELGCEFLPKVGDGEGAFAASDTNIKTIGDKTWIISGGLKSRVFYSGDKGNTWEVYDTPIVQGSATEGAYSVDFYDCKHGIIYGGDYTKPTDNKANVAITDDGGKTWQLSAQGKNQGYKSCVQYVPNSLAKELIATGNEGMSYSYDGGATWLAISDAPFLTLRFVNDSVAYAGGTNVLARLYFQRGI